MFVRLVSLAPVFSDANSHVDLFDRITRRCSVTLVGTAAERLVHGERYSISFPSLQGMFHLITAEPRPWSTVPAPERCPTFGRESGDGLSVQLSWLEQKRRNENFI